MMAFRVYAIRGHAAMTVADQMMNGVHRANLFLGAELDIGVYAYLDILEAITKIEEHGSEHPRGVIGIVTDYSSKKAKATGAAANRK